MLSWYHLVSVTSRFTFLVSEATLIVRCIGRVPPGLRGSSLFTHMLRSDVRAFFREGLSAGDPSSLPR